MLDANPAYRQRPSRRMRDILYSESFRTAIYQIALAGAVGLLGLFLYQNVIENLQRQNIATGFGFLREISQFEIGETLIEYSSRDTYFRALVVGLLNTLKVSAAGIVLATLVGFCVGIARVSNNWLLQRIATGYVEIVRNIPVILQVIFWAAVIRNLPAPRQALDLWGTGFLSNRGLTVATPASDPAHLWMILAFVAGVALMVAGDRWAKRHREATGRHVDILWPGLALIVGLPLLVWLAFGAPHAISFPERKGFNFAGGSTVSPEFVALMTGISLYASGFIAEIVRAGIQATPKGQVEAARSIALRPRFIMRYVVLPQALRVIVPPLTSQYVSLIKNSSIAVVVGYPDLVNIGNTVMNQTGQAVEAIAVMMLVYLIVSLVTSTLMNLYNRLVAIKER
ncbi:general L-amino acid transport system permease protein [Rhizobium petrolearium]|uniref:amino acid ABC transporter permease n=1 Tax=Neorhizobium petrolearium TaxID=515361 RepID=UPI001AE8EEA4|nr:ABC transporter permease subunit [Neorhizobium petrolearium]MBP1845619.1 general L-amino acid transport system permease protein [Neorhizobium petrolearium]